MMTVDNKEIKITIFSPRKTAFFESWDGTIEKWVKQNIGEKKKETWESEGFAAEYF